MPFTDFISRLMPLLESDEDYGAHFPPSSWKRMYDVGMVQPSGGLHFDAQRISDDLLDGAKLHDVATPFARDLNAEFSKETDTSKDVDPAAPGVPEPIDAPDAAADDAAADDAAADDATTVPDWEFPVYDFSREDLAIPLPAVSVSVLNSGALRYTWDDPGQGEVYRVTTSDTDAPFNPEDSRQAAVTEHGHAEDPEPLTTSIRFVTVWGYDMVDAGAGLLGQARRIAEGIHIRPLEGWDVVYERAEQTAYARWKAPEFPPHMRGVVRTAKLPPGDTAGRYLRNQSWLSSQFAISNNGYGFQDPSLEPGQRHTYVAAIEVEVEGSTRLSVPEHREITPVAEPDRIRDLELETVTLDGVEQLRLIWTQRSGTRVTFYRSNTPTDPEAVARGLVACDQLSRAGLSDDQRVRNVPHPTGEDAGDGREQWVVENLHWPSGTAWDTIHLTPVAEVDGTNVVIGQPVQRRRAGRVDGVTVVQRMNWQLVTFTWPGDAIAVELRIGPMNSRAALDSPPYLTVEKREYERNGGFRIDRGLPPQGCRLFLTSVTHFAGRRISSQPTVAAIEPLWGYMYNLHWSGTRPSGKPGLFSRAADLFRQTAAEIQISAVVGACPEHEAPYLTLVHNSERLPLHAEDGRRIDLFLERHGGHGPLEPVRSVRAPVTGMRSVWFDHSEHGPGWYRLLVDAPPASSLPPIERRTALERYALADPALHLLQRR